MTHETAEALRVEHERIEGHRIPSRPSCQLTAESLRTWMGVSGAGP